MDTIFSDNSVTVTHSLVKATDGTTYQIRQINSTHLTHTPPPKFAYGVGGFFVGSMAIGLLSSIFGKIEFLSSVLPILNLGVIGYSIYYFVKLAKPEYYISLRTSSGEIKAFQSKDQQWVRKINDAILEAMTKAA